MESNHNSKFSSVHNFEIPSEPPSYDELFGTQNTFFLDTEGSEFLTGIFEFKLKQKFKKEGKLKTEIKFETKSSLQVKSKEYITKEDPFIHFKLQFKFNSRSAGQTKLPQTILLTPYLQKVDTKYKENKMRKDGLALLKNSVGASVMKCKSRIVFEPQTIELYNLWIYDSFKKNHECSFKIPLILRTETLENTDLFEEASYLLNFDIEIENSKTLLETGFPIKLE